MSDPTYADILIDNIPVRPDDKSTWLQRFASFIKGGGWQDPQPGQRGTFVPGQVGQDGKVSPAVPGIIQQPAEGLYGLMTAPLSDIVRSGDRDAIRAASEASFDVASMLPAAGVAAGRTMPTNAAGMGGGRLDPPLPMDKASRMARAKEMGFDTDTTYYHGSPDFRGVKNAGEFESRTTSRYNAETGTYEKAPQAVYFTPDRRVAATYADDRRAWDYQNAEPEIFQAMLRPGNVLEIDAGGQKFSNLDRTLVKMQLPREQQAEFDRLLKTYGNSPEGRSIKTGDLELIANMLGYDGFRLRGVKDAYDGGGKPTDVMALYDPSRIRSVNAAFDPAKKNSANLLASNPDDVTPASILAAMSGLDQPGRMTGEDVLKATTKRPANVNDPESLSQLQPGPRDTASFRGYHQGEVQPLVEPKNWDYAGREGRQGQPAIDTAEQMFPQLAAKAKDHWDVIDAAKPILSSLRDKYGANIIQGSRLETPQDTARMIQVVNEGVKAAGEKQNVMQNYAVQLVPDAERAAWIADGSRATLYVGTKATSSDVASAIKSRIAKDGRWKPFDGVYSNPDDITTAAILALLTQQQGAQPQQ